MACDAIHNIWQSVAFIVNYGIWYQILGFMESLDTSESTDKNSGNECKIRLTSKIRRFTPILTP